MEHAFNWLSLIPGFEYEKEGHIFMAALVMMIVLITAFIARVQLSAAMKREDQGLIPDQNLTFRNFFEIIAEKIYALAVAVMGKHGAEKYFPLVGALFIFIFASNLIGLVPGVLPSTENTNTTLGLGVFVFLYYNYVGLKENGLAYFKHFMGPVWWLAFLIFPIEVVSHVFRPLSLALRLRGNIMGDHLVLSIFNGMTPYVIPVIFYGMGIFVCFVQAFVFCLMTMVYISLSQSHEH